MHRPIRLCGLWHTEFGAPGIDVVGCSATDSPFCMSFCMFKLDLIFHQQKSSKTTVLSIELHPTEPLPGAMFLPDKSHTASHTVVGDGA